VAQDDNKVLLMTIHSAKGLEFSQVYLAGMEDGVFPSYMTITSDDPSEIEEERRLAYVAITRAKDDLTITRAAKRMVRGETQYNPVSRFVKEIPPLLLDGNQSNHSSYSNHVSEKPKAIPRKKETPAANKPYIAKSLDALTKGMPTTQGSLSYTTGDRVRHIKYGEGTVLKIEQDVRDYKITVAFDSAGQKIMYAAFAKLQKI